MDNNRKKSTVLCAGIFVVLVIWIILTVPCQAAETDNDEKQSQIIRVGSFEDTFDYVHWPITAKRRRRKTIWM